MQGNNSLPLMARLHGRVQFYCVKYTVRLPVYKNTIFFFNNKLIHLCLIIKECYISLVNKNYYFENSDTLEKFKQELKYFCEAVCNIHVVVAMCDDR